MEQKLDGLVARLAQPENGRASSVASSTPYSEQQSLPLDQRDILLPRSIDGALRHPASDSGNDFSPSDSHRPPTRNSNIERALHHADTADTGEAQRKAPAPQAQVSNDENVSKTFANGLIGNAESEILLNEFRSLSDFFPFAAISSNTTAERMRLDEPMLLLAILMTASCRNRPLQNALYLSGATGSESSYAYCHYR